MGRTISDRYRIVELVAMGAMGAVYKGEHLLMRKQVAIKVLHPEIEDFPELVARFEREAIAGAHISHVNVASASDFGKFDGDSYFLILEYIEGTTLSDILKEGPMQPLRAVKLAKQLAAALGAAHQRGVVHRDVKPKNIMICEPGVLETAARGGEDEVVKLIDFGLAKVPVQKLSSIAQDPVTDGAELTNAGVVMGTVSYMAPETALGMGAVQEKADLYSLGIIMYEMLCGKHPFDAVEPQKIFAAHCSLPPPPFAQRNPNVRVPPALEAIVMRLLEKDPANRYPDADSLIAALDAFKMRVGVEGSIVFEPRPMPAKVTTGEHTPLPSAASGRLYVPKQPTKKRAIDGFKLWAIGGFVAAVVLGVTIFAVASGGGEKRAGSSAAGPRPSASMIAPPPSARPSASATVAASTSAPAVPTAPPSPAGPSQVLRDAVNAGPAAAVQALENLIKTQPDAFKEPTVQTAAAAALERIAEADLPETANVFDQLATSLGEPGLDVLYELATGPEESKAGVRARALLDKPDVFNRGSAAMRTAYDLRRASCQKRPFLFPRAAKEGDDRSLAILTSMLPPACEPRVSPCCFLKHGELERAMGEIRTRLRR